MKPYSSKSLIILLVFIGLGQSLLAQIVDPVSWSYESKEVGPNQFELIFTAEIDPGWHL